MLSFETQRDMDSAMEIISVHSSIEYFKFTYGSKFKSFFHSSRDTLGKMWKNSLKHNRIEKDTLCRTFAYTCTSTQWKLTLEFFHSVVFLHKTRKSFERNCSKDFVPCELSMLKSLRTSVRKQYLLNINNETIELNYIKLIMLKLNGISYKKESASDQRILERKLHKREFCNFENFTDYILLKMKSVLRRSSVYTCKYDSYSF